MPHIEAGAAVPAPPTCWKPGCETPATAIDWAGWKWCDSHKDTMSGGHYRPFPTVPEPLREELANLCHRQWSGWMEYLFNKCDANPDGSATIPAWAVERWQRQITTPYTELSPDEQDSDRKEADRFIALIERHGG